MLTIELIQQHVREAIAQAIEAKNPAELAHLQQMAGLLMKPAHLHNDQETEYAFRVLAAKAANAREALLQKED
ncbi:hypothetical protein [Herpetosiphon giganteus]|uniref:hypothetical protein n=1 Tax=Herpetosiphon giganteus TaxID=2029754 RepID=UPI00195802A0|nr:hypothetical protein [Herpetosiphon giganteus]MBM7842339.1 hypothetical protein [Herpetosiphon giganteus]